MTGDITTREVGGTDSGLWRRLAEQVDRLDADAGRVLHAALERHAGPLRIQVAGRAGTDRGEVRQRLGAKVADGANFEDVTVDAPGSPDRALDGDVVVYVLPTRLDPASVHPADRAVLAGLDAGRVVAVLAGSGPVGEDVAAVTEALATELQVPVFDAGDPGWQDAVADRLRSAHLHRDRELARTAAGTAACPAARDAIEAVLDTVAAQ